MFTPTRTLSRAVLITGSTKGLGNNLARKFLQNTEYDTVFVHGSSVGSVSTALKHISGDFVPANAKKVVGVVCDFGASSDLDFIPVLTLKSAEDVPCKLKNFSAFLAQNRLDHIILNHAVSQEKLLVQLPNEEISKIFNVNIISYIQLAKTVLNVWIKKNVRKKETKKIATIGSILNEFSEPKIKGNAVYAMSKKNVEFLSQMMVLEYGSRFGWLKISHHNIPFLSDSGLVKNKKLLSDLHVDSDTVENVSAGVYKQEVED